MDNQVSLKELIAKFQEEESSALEEVELINMIRAEKYLVPVDKTNRNNPSFVLIRDSDGNIYYPIFTDKEEYGKYEENFDTENIEAVILEIEDVFYMCLSNLDSKVMGITINPFSENFMIYRDGIERFRRFNYISEDDLKALEEIEDLDFKEFVKSNPKNEDQIKYLLSLNFWYMPMGIFKVFNEGGERHISIFTSAKEALKFSKEFEEGLPFIRLTPKNGLQELIDFFADNVHVDNIAKIDGFVGLCDELLATHLEGRFREIESIEDDQERTREYLKNVFAHPLLYEVVIGDKEYPTFLEKDGNKFVALFTSEELVKEWIEQYVKKDIGAKIKKIDTSVPVSPRYKGLDFIILNRETTVSLDNFKKAEEIYS